MDFINAQMQLNNSREELIYEEEKLNYGQFIRTLGLLQLTTLPYLDISS